LRSSRIAAVAALAATAAATPASAHVVQPGDTLSGIAAANGLSTEELAAANGMSPDGPVILGTEIEVPVAGAPSQAAPPPMGGYVVQPGETLSGIAAASGVSTDELAWMNGLDPSEPLIAGEALKLPTSTSTTAAPTNIPDAAPYPSPGYTSSSEVASIASQHGVSGSLAAAIAYQESGFNNAMVSSANARGVMQVMPGTWEWVEQNLSGPLDPSSTQDNIRAGSLYLGQLLQDTGGDERMAVAAYYQGLGSVQQNGMLPETVQYVDNVMALKARFGG
jgi:N-acetylmuramoyl-L-alanine amidase